MIQNVQYASAGVEKQIQAVLLHSVCCIMYLSRYDACLQLLVLKVGEERNYNSEQLKLEVDCFWTSTEILERVFFH